VAAPFDFNHLVIRMLGDAKFRAAVIKNPEKALRAIKAKPTKQQVAALKAVDWASLEKVFNSFKKGVHPNTFS
jgi:hypothetical protein